MKPFDLDALKLGLRAELIANWYLRFNGYFPLTSFILHDAGATKQPGGQITDADILAIRLPYTEEIIEGPAEPIRVKTDPQLDVARDFTDFIIAEVSSQECKFNWLNEESQTVEVKFLDYCLRRFGTGLRMPYLKLARSCRLRSALFLMIRSAFASGLSPSGSHDLMASLAFNKLPLRQCSNT